MQREDIIEHNDEKVHVFTFSVQEEDILEDSNVKCHLCTL